jgi:hypothetical protein
MEGLQKDRAIKDKKPVKNHKRLIGAGIKTLGFIESVFKIANANPGFTPRYTDETLFNGKLRELKDLISLKDISIQFAKAVNDAYLHKSNDCYHNALEYYFGLKEAAKYGRSETAQRYFNELKPFFKKEKKLAESE